MRSSLSRSIITAFCAVALSTTVEAQAFETSDSAAAPAAADSRTVATIMAPVVSDEVTRPAHQQIAPVVRRRAIDRSTTLMIVGGALIVTGMLVGSDAAPILYIAGAGIGGYGLYLYLQSPDTQLP